MAWHSQRGTSRPTYSFVVLEIGVPEAVERAHALAAGPGRNVLGITGPPGAGKSTLAQLLLDVVPGAVLVGMDAFHLAHSVLESLGRVEVKGAPQTFDAAGYAALLRRIREGGPDIIWVPEFRREIEDAVAGVVAVSPQTTLVVTEGNYLLREVGPWAQVRGLLDEVWYAAVPDEVRRLRLAKRHESYGRGPHAALERTLGSDEANARTVAATKARADVIVLLD